MRLLRRLTGRSTSRPEEPRDGAPPHGRRGDGADAISPATREAVQRRTVGVSPEILRQVRLVELRTRRLVDSLFAGEYRSVFKGQGMEFAEVREYQPGDEVRTIDWNVTARMGRPFVKRYIEERELTVVLLVDLSGSARFGTVRRFKSELAAELAAVLTMSAVRNNDRVGLVLFTDRVEHVVPPRKGRRHGLRVLRDLMVHEPVGRGTDLAGAVDYLSRMLAHRSVVFILSDFQDEGIERPLKRLARQHDVVAVTVTDPAERTLPDAGVVRFRDPETGQLVDVDTSDRALRERFDQRVESEVEERRRLLRRLAMDEIVIDTDSGYLDPLLRFFRARSVRLRGTRSKRGGRA
ncbi:MAG TPA: DUF58 domain-containing protein [Gemmatimonadales bacterium]